MNHFVSLNLYLTHQTDMNQGGTLSNFQFFSDLQEIRPTYLPTWPSPTNQTRNRRSGVKGFPSGFAPLPVTIWLWFTMIGRSWRICTSESNLFEGQFPPSGICLLEKKQGGQFVTSSLVTRVGLVCLFVCLFGWLVGWLIDWLVDWLIDWLIDSLIYLFIYLFDDMVCPWIANYA